MASVALLTVTGLLSQAVGFAYRVGLTTGVSNLSAWYQALGDRRAILIFIKKQRIY